MPCCSEEMTLSTILSHLWATQILVMNLSHIIIRPRSWLPMVSSILWPSHYFDCLFAIRICWIVKSWSCGCSTFLRIYKWSQSKAILWLFNNLGRNIICCWTRLLDRLWSPIFIILIDWPSWLWFFFCGIKIVRIMSSWSWNISDNLWINEFSLCLKMIMLNGIEL